MLHTLLIKHYNDLLEKQRSEQVKDEVSYFYVGEIFFLKIGITRAKVYTKIIPNIEECNFILALLRPLRLSKSL